MNTDAHNHNRDTPDKSQFAQFGFEIIDELLSATQVEMAIQLIEGLDATGAGTRKLLELTWCRELVETIKQNCAISRLLPPEPVAIQCTLFDKSPKKNWLVAPHQDLVVPVKKRVSHPELGVWSEKEGQLFVQVPPAMLMNLVAVRISLDDCARDNGALRVIPGSHLSGRLDQNAAQRLKERNGETVCEVNKASAMVIRPLLLHASSKAVTSRRRRVLHFLFAPTVAGFGLEWQYAV